MTWSGEINPATLDQVQRGRGGKMVTIESDVANVAADLKRIDPRLCLRWSEAGEYFVVYGREPWMEEGHGWLVGTFQELDQRIVKSIEETYWKHRQPGYSLGEELNEQHDEATARQEEAFSEQTQEMAERLAHAIRKDLNMKGRIFIP